MKRTTLIITGLILVAVASLIGAITLMFLHHPPEEWGWVLAIAFTSAILS